MRTLGYSWAVLLVAAASQAQDAIFERRSFEQLEVDNNDMSIAEPRDGYYGYHPPHSTSTFQIGPVNVQTGPNWSVNVANFIKINQKPNGGVNVNVQLPEFPNIFGRGNNPQGTSMSSGDDPSTRQLRRRRNAEVKHMTAKDGQIKGDDSRDKENIPAGKSRKSEAQEEESPSTKIKIGDLLVIDTGNNWSVVSKFFHVKKKEGGGVDVQVNQPGKGEDWNIRKMFPSNPQNPQGPLEDPSVGPQKKRRRRGLNYWALMKDRTTEI